ncbi:MAG: hypothetical protein ACYSX0_07930 [Planctomycetota bacterium]|jgi:hypothetical protein
MRLALIPIGGTVAALIAILVCRAPREEDRNEPIGIVPPPPPAAETFMLELKEDGSLFDMDTRSIYATADEFLGSVRAGGEARPQVTLFTLSAKVPKEKLDEAADRLRNRCDVRVRGYGAEDE